MKVRCIGENSQYYTVGKLYDVITNSSEYFYMKDFTGFVNKSLFEDISEIRNEKLKKLGI
mgnify:CR=1 FL=1|jgi:hypothetical protein